MSRVGLGLLLLIAVLAALALTILLTAPKVQAQQLDPPLSELPCIHYDTAIERFAAAGWTVLDDVVLPEDFEADRLLVVVGSGYAVAAPVVKGCVPRGFNIPLGYVDLGEGEPA
jgi:hypothetical protein